MSRLLMSLVLVASCTGLARADDAPVRAANAVRATLGDAGCRAGEVKYDDGLFEAQNVQCPDGRFDIKLDEDLNIVGMDRDR